MGNASPLANRYRTALVTGASTGLGRAFAGMLLGEGVRVWGTSRSAERLEELRQSAGGAFIPVELELGPGSDLPAVFQRIEAEADGFDLVIANAGFSVFGRFEEVEFSEWREQCEVMLLQVAQLCHLALPGMRRRGRGALVNVSSLGAEFPLPFQSGYNIVKAGVSALSESLMMECAGTGVVMVDLRPGDYRTDFAGSVRRPNGERADPSQQRVWAAFVRMMERGPDPAGAAEALRRALERGRSGTVRCGSFFQSRVAPFLARMGSLRLRRRVQAGYFDLS